MGHAVALLVVLPGLLVKLAVLEAQFFGFDGSGRVSRVVDT